MLRTSVRDLALLGVLWATTSCGPHAEPEIHLIQAGYTGDVFIIHEVKDGEPAKHEGRFRVYEIPASGILRSQTPTNFGWSLGGEIQRYYVSKDGTRTRIEGFWPSSIHDTVENRTDPTLGIWFPRTGTISSGSSSCDVHFDQYYVGTKSFLLDRKNTPELMEYLEDNPVPCRGPILSDLP